MRRPTITERLIHAKDGYRQGLVIGAAVGFFLAKLSSPALAFVVLAAAGSYAMYQVISAALES